MSIPKTKNLRAFSITPVPKRLKDDLDSMMKGKFYINIDQNDSLRPSSVHNNSRLSARSSRTNQSIRDEVQDNRLIIQGMDPKRVHNLKEYQKVNKSLFEFRKTVVSIKMSIIQKAYDAYNKLLEIRGKKKVKFIIVSKALNLHENRNLNNELKITPVIENISQRNNAIDIQK